MRSLVPALALACLISGCTLNTDYFAEYRGVNLLGNYDFDAVESDGVTAKWKLATSSDFVRWERISPTSSDPTRDTAASVPTVGPDGVSPVYRVEIKNLIPNGDFEDSTVTPDTVPPALAVLPPYWAMKNYAGGAAAGTSEARFGSTYLGPSRPGTINGRILGWSAGTNGDQIALDLYDAITSFGANLGPWSAGRYVVRVDLMDLADKQKLGLFPFTTSPYAPVSSALASPDWTVITIGTEEAVHSTVNTFFTDPGATTNPTKANHEPRFLAIGDDGDLTGPYAAAIDNVRVVPDDQILGVRADFPSLGSGVKPLLPGSKKGMYKFSVWVRNDPTAGTLNRFEPIELTVRLVGSVKSGDPSFPSPSGLRPTGGWPTWTQLQFDMGFDFVNTDGALNGNPALSIFLIPTNGSTGSPDAGSLLVSQPVLTFNP